MTRYRTIYADPPWNESGGGERDVFGRRKQWTAAEDALLRELYPDHSSAELARRFKVPIGKLYQRANRMGLKKSAEYTKQCLSQCGQQISSHPRAIAARFHRGLTPHNKGKKMPGFAPGRMAHTQFKKGQAPHTWMPVGSTRLIGGYLYRKVSDIRDVTWTRNWVAEHIRTWEEVNGPLNRATHALKFKDGDRTHIALENLELITRAENMLRNTVHNLPPDLKQVIQLTGAIKRKLTIHERKQRQCQKTA